MSSARLLTFSRPDRALSLLGGRKVLARKSESAKSECNYLPAALKYEAARICSQQVWALEICGLLILERRVTSSLVNSAAPFVS